MLVYCNSLLATLNVRKVIRERAHNDLGISLRPVTTIGSKDNRKVCIYIIRTLLTLIQSLAVGDSHKDRDCGIRHGRQVPRFRCRFDICQAEHR